MARSAWRTGDGWHPGAPVGDYFWPEAVKLAALFGVSAGVDRWLAGNSIPPEAVDYDDRFAPAAR